VALSVNLASEAAKCTTAKVQPQQPRKRTAMNNRMKQLAEQAGMQAFPPVMDYDRIETQWVGWESSMKKFAELIVKECGLIVDELAGGQMGGASSYDLNKHFGIT